MLKPNYSCTQQQLFTVGRAAWQACNDRLPAFTAFKAKYSAAFVADKLNAISAAEALPDDEQRRAVAALLREQLKQKAGQGRDAWQRLKLYTLDAFPENESEILLAAAGSAHYEKALRQNWDSVKRLLIDGEQFIAGNTAALLANNNMPASFPADFTSLKTAFEALYYAFMNASLNGELKTDEKLSANNLVHKELMALLEDGKRLYAKDEAVRRLFTFEQLLLDVAGPGQAGLKGVVRDAATTLPIEGVSVQLMNTAKSAVTDAEGRYSIAQLAGGSYTLHFSKAGYVTKVVEDVEVETSVTKTVEVEMNNQ